MGLLTNLIVAFTCYVICLTLHVSADELPTSYEYYTSDGITTGLSADQPYFTLNNKNISIYSGALHYFRVPRAYWRDRLRKIRAAGLNTVETYVPWNLHEPQSGTYDFGDGGSDMADFLHLEEFLQTAQEEDLFVLMRSGPFICAEFEFGGFPSWLLREKDIVVRTSDEIYMKYVTRYFNVLLPILEKYQFTKGGPIIAFQVENEYALMNKKADKEYLKQLRQLMLDNGIVELLVTSDNPVRGTIGSIPDLFLLTGNFDSDPKTQLDMLNALEPTKPMMVMEYWSGWFDYWGSRHNSKNSSYVQEVYEGILSYPSSVNIYIFIGSTNFGFLNGASNLKFDDLNTGFSPVTSSYDYDSPITESGDYTEKFYIIKELLDKYNPVKTKIPDAPEIVAPVAYSDLSVDSYIPFEDLLENITPVESTDVVSMENLDINNGNGQSYGYVTYRKTNLDIPANSVLTIEGRVCDTVIVLVNGVRVSPVLEKSADLDAFGTWRTQDSTLTLTTEDLEGATLDLVVENWGRVNVAVYKQYKGLWQGDVLLNNEKLTDWTIYPLEFKTSWTNSLTNWQQLGTDLSEKPGLYKATLNIQDEPKDTFVYTENWTKGIVIVNGFVLGRYAKMGPQQTLYLPAPLLKQGTNEILLFEHFQPASQVQFLTSVLYNRH